MLNTTPKTDAVSGTLDDWARLRSQGAFSSPCFHVGRSDWTHAAASFVRALESIEVGRPLVAPGRPGQDFRRLLRDGEIEAARRLFLSRTPESWSINGLSSGILLAAASNWPLSKSPNPEKRIRHLRAAAQLLLFLFAGVERQCAVPILFGLAHRISGDASAIVQQHEALARERLHESLDRHPIGYDARSEAFTRMESQPQTYGPCYTTPGASPWLWMWMQLLVLKEETQASGIDSQTYAFSLVSNYRMNRADILALDTATMRQAYAAWEAQTLREDPFIGGGTPSAAPPVSSSPLESIAPVDATPSSLAAAVDAPPCVPVRRARLRL